MVYVDYLIKIIVGPEVLTGSTRLKSGTATKIVLNMGVGEAKEDEKIINKIKINRGVCQDSQSKRD